MRAPAPAKINLALVVGPTRPDGKHEVATVLQRVDLADRVAIVPGAALTVTGFAGDTIVRDALVRLAAAAGVEPRWTATITKRIPVAAGLGGGSSDAATALRLANETLAAPLAPADLHELAATLGADVPFFLDDGPQLGRGDGSTLEPLEPAAGLLDRARAPGGRRQALHRRRLCGLRRARRRCGLGRAPLAPRRGARGGSPSARPRGAAVRTTSPRRRSRRSCSGTAPFGPTSAAPGRRSTASSTTGGRRTPPGARSAAPARPG